MLKIANIEAKDDGNLSSDKKEDIKVPTNVEGKYALASLLKIELLNQIYSFYSSNTNKCLESTLRYLI